MSKSRLPGSRRKTRKSTENLTKFHRFIGISLSGGKTDKACVAVVEYYPEHKKVFLARLFERIKAEPPLISADLNLYETLVQYEGEAELLAFDVPLTLPKCLRCDLVCPGYEKCQESEIKWFRYFYEKLNKTKKPKRMFTPYTQRCAETFISLELEEKFELQHTLGANIAPLTARALFMSRRLKIPKIEVFPKLSVWRIGQQLKVSKSHLLSHKHAIAGEASRGAFLSALSDRRGVFIYQQDFRHMVENNHAFEAFISAYTAYLSFLGQTEKRPSDFPKEESWIEFPEKS
jgi:hypothetical protein